MIRFHTLLSGACAVLAVAPIMAAAQGTTFPWRIELNAPDSVRALLEAHMDVYHYRKRARVDALLLERLAERAEKDARRLLATEGYFTPEVNARSIESKDMHVLRIDVQPGEPARVAAISIQVTGPIASAASERERVKTMKTQWALKPGERFRQAEWDRAKETLLSALLLDGYPKARITQSEALVRPDAHAADLSVAIDSGPLFHFGQVRISGLSRYPRALVANLNPIHPGDRYEYDALLRYQAALQASGYFSSASVSIDADAARNARVPINVQVTEYPSKKIELGVGYSTNTGPRAQAAFSDYSTLRPGWQSETRLTLEGKQQSATTGLAFLPERSGWRNRVGAEFARTDVQGLVTERVGVLGTRAWRIPREDREITLKFQTETQKIGSVEVDTLHALSLNYSWTVRRVDDLLRPREGYLLNLQIGGAAEPLLTTRSFSRTYARGLYIVPLGARDRVHLRGEAGAVWSDGRDGIPNEFLFRAGGDQSIRGYSYNSLGERIGDAVVGVRYLAVGTVEYQHDLTPDWGAAVFYDAGNAVDNWADFRAVYGYGAGVRYLSPAGSINFDVARASETGKIRLHFTIGARF